MTVLTVLCCVGPLDGQGDDALLPPKHREARWRGHLHPPVQGGPRAESGHQALQLRPGVGDQVQGTVRAQHRDRVCAVLPLLARGGNDDGARDAGHPAGVRRQLHWREEAAVRRIVDAVAFDGGSRGRDWARFIAVRLPEVTAYAERHSRYRRPLAATQAAACCCCGSLIPLNAGWGEQLLNSQSPYLQIESILIRRQVYSAAVLVVGHPAGVLAIYTDRLFAQ
eukprot:548654-Pyramimonas_sp.AAC.1